MKNVTITLADDIATAARVEAAKQDKSLSRFIADMLAREVGRSGVSQREAVERFLNGPDFPGLSADMPNRDELYAERLFHRHERLPVRQGPDESGEAGKSPRMDRGTRK